MEESKPQLNINVIIKENDNIVVPKFCAVIGVENLFNITLSENQNLNHKNEKFIQVDKEIRNDLVSRKRKGEFNINSLNQTQTINMKKSKYSMDRHKTISEIKRLSNEIKKYEEIIINECNEEKQKLKETKINDEVIELDELIEKWRKGCQYALIDLKNIFTQENIPLSELVKNLNIDPKLLKFNIDEEDFY